MNKVHLRILVIFILFMSLVNVANSVNDTNSSLNNTTIINTNINISIDQNSSENISQSIIENTTSELVDETIQKVKDSIRIIKTQETEQTITLSYVGTDVTVPVYRIVGDSIRYGVGDEITLNTNYVDENTTIELYDSTTLITSSIYSDIEVETPTLIEETPAVEERITQTIPQENITRIENTTVQEPTSTTKTSTHAIKIERTAQQYYVHNETRFILDMKSLAREVSEQTPETIFHVNSILVDSRGRTQSMSFKRINDSIDIILPKVLAPESYTLTTNLFYNNKSYVHSIPLLVDAVKLPRAGVRIYNTTYPTTVADIRDSLYNTLEMNEFIINSTSTRLTPTTGVIKALTLHSKNISELDADYLGLETELYSQVGPNNKLFKQAYAIDPEQINITTIDITVTAKGNSLYKCTEWNFTTQTCYGEWNFIQAITPGENYTVTVDRVDPAFGEGDTESLSDSCTFSDQSGQGDGDSGANCQTEINSNNGGFTVDLEDLETTGTTSQLDATFTNSFLVDAVNGVNLSIKYQRQTNTQVGATTASIQLFDSGAYTTVCTDAVTIGSWETYTCDLSSLITTEAELNSVNIRLLFDTASSGQPKQVGKTFVDYMYLDINYDETDVIAPTYSTVETNIASPTTYSQGTTYLFNTTWTDNVALSSVVIEENFTGTLQNSSPSSSGSIYSYSSVLPAGTYTWKYIATDTNSNENSTPSQTFIVNKASPALTLELNESSSNLATENSDTINITATGTSQGIIEILRDGVIIAQGTGSVTQLESFSSTGTFNITARYNATQNYSVSTQTYFVTLIDTIPPGVVTGLANITSGDSWIYWNWTNPIDTDFDHVEVWINGSFIENTTNSFVNATGLFSDTEYEVQVRTADIYDNVGVTTTDLGKTLVSLDVTPPVLSNIQNISITEQSAIINWTTDEIATSRVKYGTSSGMYTKQIYNAFGTTDHSLEIINLAPSTSYYYVVNSTDPAGNGVQSTEYSFTTLPDTQAPEWSNIETTPSSPQTYNGITVEFNTTWTDNIEIDTVVIEHNFTGTTTNYSTSNSSNEYTYSYELPAGTYSWRYIATDIYGNSNATPSQTYIINKASPALTLELDEINNNITVDEDTLVNVTGSLVTPTSGSLELRRNGSLVAVGSSSATSLASYQPGTYEFAFTYFASTNYSAQTIYKTLTVSDTTPPNVTLGLPANNSVDLDSTTVFTYTTSDNVGVTSCAIYLNGVLNDTDTSISASDSFTIENFVNGTYIWIIECVDAAGNYRNSTARQFNASIEPPISINVNPSSTTSWNDADAIVLSDINSTNAITESRSVPRNTYIQIDAVNFTANIPPGSTITGVTFNAYHQGTTRVDFNGINWYNGSNYISTGCTPVTQTGAFRTDTCDLSNVVDTVDEANDISIQYLIFGQDAGGTKTITIDHLYVSINYLPELTPPLLTVNNITIDITETVGEQIVASDANGIASYAINDSRFSINSSGYLVNITNLPEGAIPLRVEVRDPSDNFENKSFFVFVQDLATVEIETSTGLTIYNSSGHVVASGTGTFNESLLRNKLYRLEYSSTGFYGIQRTTLYDVNLSTDINITTQYNDSYTGTLPEYIPDISTIFALDEPNANYSYAQVTLPKAGADIEYILHCTAWNFTDQTCSTWEVNETADYEFNQNTTHFTINVTGFDAFGGGPGDTLPNMTLLEIYDVTGQGDGTTGGTFLASGFDTNFSLESNKAYRVEFNITNLAKKWILAGADIATHSGLNETWNVSNITYSIAGTDYVGGTWTSGTVTWDLSLGGQLDQGDSGTWYYVVNITTAIDENYSVSFTVNDTSKSSGSVDYSNFTIIADTPSWQTYYGTIDFNITLGNNGVDSIFSWFTSDATGIMYAIDSDASINFANLYGLGRNTSNETSTNDFAEIDDALNMTGQPDSVMSYYASDSSTPLFTRNYTIGGRTITNVPAINSTTTSNFQTGILWDATSDTTGEYDENETLVFITTIENMLLGSYGTYDYELIVPENLQVTEGVNPTLDIYIELE